MLEQEALHWPGVRWTYDVTPHLWGQLAMKGFKGISALYQTAMWEPGYFQTFMFTSL
jgi:hypothetical protein